MHAMLFAAGLGTRLRPLTLERPKPVAPVANHPLAAFAMAHLASAGVSRIVANVHHLPDIAAPLLDAATPPGVTLRVLHEPELLGTGGGLHNAWPTLREELADDAPIVVMNSDILFAPDLARVLETHRALGAVATMVLRSDPNAARYGAVEVDAAGRVRRLLGKPAPEPGPESLPDAPSLTPYMFTGVHILSADAIADLPASGCIIRHSYRRWVDSGRTVAAIVDESPWRDLGTLSEYLHANLDLASGALRSPLVTPDTTPRAALIDPSASIGASAHIERSVVGPRAHIAPGVRLTRSVVWEGCRVDVDADGVCVAPNGITAIL